MGSASAKGTIAPSVMGIEMAIVPPSEDNFGLDAAGRAGGPDMPLAGIRACRIPAIAARNEPGAR